MTTEQQNSVGTVTLAEGFSAAAILHDVLTTAGSDFGLPLAADVQSFRKRYPALLPAFELARSNHAQRSTITERALLRLREHIMWTTSAGAQPLYEHLQAPATPLACHSLIGPGQPGWPPGVVYRGQRWTSAQLDELATQLVTRNVISQGAGNALTALQPMLGNAALDLSDRRVVVLGAGAEMASTRLWLSAGATVLWLDINPPPQNWLDDAELAGTLVWPEQSVNLLRDPGRIKATIEAFAEGGPLDLALYAYAPGQARELLLTSVMNEIVNALPAAIIRSVTLLVSPTTPTPLDAADVAAVQTRAAARPGWEAALDRLHLLGGKPGLLTSAEIPDRGVVHNVVSIQGASYQAAQYLGKVLIAEHWANQGQLGSAEPSPLRVSANTAAITKTRSMNHPIFAAAFVGATAFGVETMTPRQSRALNGLLAVHDWLRAEPPTPGLARIHGGIHTLPYPLEAALRVAATIGFARAPRLIKGLF